MKKFLPAVVLVLLMCIHLACLDAQEYIVLKGHVIDERAQPLSGVAISGANSSIGCYSDENGYFDLDLPQSVGYVHVSYLGYESKVIPISDSLSQFIVTIQIYPQYNLLQTATVTAGTIKATDDKGSALRPLDIVTTAGALGDINGALRTLPGVVTLGESGRLFVRGGDAHETQVFFDGILAPVPYTTSAPNVAVRGRFSPFMFQGTALSTGGYSAEYGQALSSVLQLQTKDMPQEDQVDISIMSTGLELATTKKWEHSSLIASASYTNLHPYSSLVRQNIELEKGPKAVNTEIQFRQELGKNSLLKAYGTWSTSSASYIFPKEDLGDGEGAIAVENDNVFGTATWSGLVGNKWRLFSGFSYTDNTDRTGFFSSAYTDARLRSFFSKFYAKYYPLEGISIAMGAEWNRRKYTDLVSYLGNGDYRILEDDLSATFLEMNVALAEPLSLRVGARSEYSSLLEEFQVSPRLSASYAIDESQAVSLAYGQFRQQPKQEYLLRSNQIGSERAEHFILGYQLQNKNRFFRLELYSKKYKNLIREQDGFLSNEGYGHANGVDLFFRDNSTIRNGQFWISYSYLDTKRLFSDFPVEATPSFASKHNMALVYKHMIASLTSMPSITVQYASPRSYHDPNGQGFLSERLKAYSTIDLSWSYIHRPNIIFYAATTNILGRRNVFGYRFSPSSVMEGTFVETPIRPTADRFFFLGCFITLSPSGEKNQLDKLN